jgi:dTDP-4-dehydrorhamnose reductase
MKIFITGAKGQLGWELLQLWRANHSVVGRDLPEFDITQPRSVMDAVLDFKPEIVVNCAALTKPDLCETERNMAHAVNAVGPRNVAAAAAAIDAVMVHISTDYVFDGLRKPPQAYTEADSTGPLSWYGVTKLEGESGVQAAAPRHIIVRTAWLYGAHGNNFPKTILFKALASPEQEIKVVDDQYGSPTWTFRLAHQITALVQQDGHGLYHASAEGYCTWFEFAKAFLMEMDVPHRIHPCMTAEYPVVAKRPANSILENQRLKAAGLNCMVDWRADLGQFVAQYRARLLAEVRP